MSEKQKKQRNKIIISAIIFGITMLLPSPKEIKLIGYLLAYLCVGGEILIKAGKNIRNGQVFDENFLMAIATLGAFILGEYAEGIAVMLFYQVGELFQSYAVSQSRKSITELMNLSPDTAVVIRDGKEEVVDPEEVVIGENVIIRPGEKVPLDGIVIEGTSTLDTKALTGEPVPRKIEAGDNIISGCINLTSPLTVQVTKEFGESTVSKILELVEHATSQKAPVENFITKFARYYTPIVVICAIILALIPPMIIKEATFSDCIYRALTFLVISCPCALVISIPLSFFGGIGAASKIGVLVKGSNYLEALANVETVVFDKTGTLTKGDFNVQQIVEGECSKEEILQVAAFTEYYSNHPIATSIKKAYVDAGNQLQESQVTNITEIAGKGICGTYKGKTVYVGNEALMNQFHIPYKKVDSLGTIIYVGIEKEYAGAIVIGDEIKTDAKESISTLKKIGVKKTVMLTGDTDSTGKRIGNQLNIDEIYTELLPNDKVSHVETLLHQVSSKGTLAFVGDGMNDAPVLARADVGIAMGGLGSDAAIEAADVVLMTDEPSKIGKVIQISRKTVAICKQNIVFALGVKGVVLLLGAIGFASMWAAVFADVGVSVIAILNAMRVLYYKTKNI